MNDFHGNPHSKYSRNVSVGFHEGKSRRCGDLRYSSIRLRSDLIYANSGGGGHRSIGDILTTLEDPTAYARAIRFCLNSEIVKSKATWEYMCD